MSDYHTILILSFFRLLLACGLLFALMPALLFPRFPSRSLMERFFGMALIMAGMTMVMMYVYVFLKLNDNIAIVIISIWIIGFKWWNVYRRKHVGFVLIKSVLLRWIEILARPSTFKRLGITLGDVWRREIAVRLFYGAVFIAVIAGAVLLRIGPIWDHPAPLSSEYYETLEQVKHLQINEIYPAGGRIPIGMPIIITALCTASQVNPTLAVHFFGILSAVLLSGSIFFSVYRATHSRPEAAFASVIFAVAYTVLPGSVNHQIEADSLTLAMAFLLPSLSFFITYVTHGGRAHLIAAAAGLLAAGAVNLFAGCLGVTAAGVILCSSFLILPSLQRLRRSLLLRHGMATATIVAIILASFFSVTNGQYESSVLKIIFYDQHFNRYALANERDVSAFLSLCGGLFVALIASSMFPFAEKRWHLHLIGWGGFGMLLLMLTKPALLGLDEMVPTAQVVFVLSVTASVAAGLCTGVVLELLGKIMSAARASRSAQHGAKIAAAAALIGAALFLYRGGPATATITAEPDAFVRNLYVIERTFIPYQWTIIAHRGILLAGMNRGRFLDYDYFTAMYDPVTYRHGTPGAIPTALVFIFIEKNTAVTNISSELFSVNSDAMGRARAWCETYLKTHNDMTVFYSDDKIIIYELRDPNVPSLRV